MFTRKLLLIFTVLAFSLTAFAQETGSIKGKVRTKDGNGIDDVTVTARKDGRDVTSVETNRKGNFRLRGLSPGLYNVVFEKPGYSGGVLYDVIVKRKKTNNVGSNLVLTVDQGTLVIVEASVFSPGGFSIYGAKVVVESINEDGTSKKVASGYTSRDGDVIFRFPVGDKLYRITASGKEAKASKEIEVTDAAIYRTAITLNLSKENK